MTLILDAGGLSGLAGQQARLSALSRRVPWPPQVPSVVLAEALTGDHRRDFHTNRLLRSCQVRVVDESLARSAARLRHSTGRAATISATDALVAAFAATCDEAIVLTSDPADLAALAEVAPSGLRWLASDRQLIGNPSNDDVGLNTRGLVSINCAKVFGETSEIGSCEPDSRSARYRGVSGLTPP